jgi:hypothetical protein
MLKKILILLLILNAYPSPLYSKFDISVFRSKEICIFASIATILSLKTYKNFKKANESEKEIKRLRKILTEMGIIVKKTKDGFRIEMPSYLSQQEEKDARIISSSLIEEEENLAKIKKFSWLAGSIWFAIMTLAELDNY